MKQDGFTLIETIIYIALLMFMMGSAVIAAFYVIDASARDKAKVTSAVEAEFLIRKIDWILTGLDLTIPINAPAPGGSGTSLSVNRDGFPNPFVVDLAAHRARLSENGGVPVELTADRVAISNLNFQHIAAIPPKPAAIVASFVIGGSNFQMTKYMKK